VAQTLEEDKRPYSCKALQLASRGFSPESPIKRRPLPSSMYKTENLPAEDRLEFSIKIRGVEKIVAAETFRSSMAREKSLILVKLRSRELSPREINMLVDGGTHDVTCEGNSTNEKRRLGKSHLFSVAHDLVLD
jgi:hypothetical protein